MTMSALVLAGLQGLTIEDLQRDETEQLELALTEYRSWLRTPRDPGDRPIGG